MRRLDRIHARYPVKTKIVLIALAVACLYLADRIDQDNSTTLHWYYSAYQGQAT